MTIEPPMAVLHAGEGRSGLLSPGVDVLFKLWGEDTGGALAVVEHPFDVGAIVPPHLHTREDEYSIVLEGEIGFRSGRREVVLGPGGYVSKPRGELHAMWNAGSTPARMIEVISPAGFEHFFRELAEMVASGQVDFPMVSALATRYGLRYDQADWLPGVIERFHLTPPPQS
ncbi:MAG: cupin domain-containing protein [Micromonosporaceae bacterium]